LNGKKRQKGGAEERKKRTKRKTIRFQRPRKKNSLQWQGQKDLLKGGGHRRENTKKKTDSISER